MMGTLSDSDKWLKDYCDYVAHMENKMKLKTGGGGSDWERAPEGTHIARCCSVIDLGTQASQQFGDRDVVRIEFELCNELMTSGARFMVGREYTNFVSLSGTSNLKRDLEAWRTQPFTQESLQAFDIENLLDKPCMVTVQHRESGGKTYANIVAITAPHKGTEAAALSVEPLYFDFETRDAKAWNRLPEWLHNRIMKAKNWQLEGNLPAPAAEQEGFDDDIPF